MKDRVRERYAAQVDGLRALGALVAIMWGVEIVNALDSYRLDNDGIVPHSYTRASDTCCQTRSRSSSSASRSRSPGRGACCW
jgi:hypothetical protein